ncbi:MAG: hypothetical protein KF773_27900 [Deltaproteobacteria bacterium]|nr:hypothetical protein [Deltaproteobacteria bacterium]MCW5801921.1 hypothetical protein [Deltaproteobacteria bacterium]
MEHHPQPAAPAPQPQARMVAAQADLAPVGNTRMKPVSVVIEQQEGQPAKISEVDFQGLHPGKYQLVVHENAECGANASKVGRATMPVAATVDVAQGAPGKVEPGQVEVTLEGDQSIIGKTLVLHEVRGGKPSVPQACGQISRLEEAPSPGGAGAGAG